MLKLENVCAGYGKLDVLWDVSCEVHDGEFVAIVGPNGAGKTTTMRAISGLVRPKSGAIIFNGEHLEGESMKRIHDLGVSFITDDGNLFSGMSVKENLLMGALNIRNKNKVKQLMDKVIGLFPRLGERLNQQAGLMSGGERKMLGIARGLMSEPKLMLVDEPSLGLAPAVVMDVFRTLKGLTKEGVHILLVEQNVNTTLKIVDRAYILEKGVINGQGTSAELLNSDYVQKMYLGIE
ncbi:ABC transporter ATP-binding protein [Pusillibacter faecalis]|uniref:ABC transporter ATP-binding protein n=1 Tax=Pusillibacter faecalis TaxID=2714358 RepID=A0A810Q8C8_9FIRM|nr:ABC transporter ATP-binding protein [Pusillibacter faecalis]MCQ5027370.1 ABC transporter ATP-binding protein [Oscillibacter valericigenes]BCK84518.1 ABC transporter ATP-binding protein [Pusillibacter faecalis]